MANYVESSIGSPRERAQVSIGENGRVRVVIGTQPSGQGHETSFAQVAAELLAVPVGAINVIMGDTDIVSVGGGSHSGRSMRIASLAVSEASDAVIAKGKRIAAHMLETTPDAIDLAEGDAVVIIDGPFKDLEGKVGEIDEERGKVKVLVPMFGRETPVELEADQVQRV